MFQINIPCMTQLSHVLYASHQLDILETVQVIKCQYQMGHILKNNNPAKILNLKIIG